MCFAAAVHRAELDGTAWDWMKQWISRKQRRILLRIDDRDESGFPGVVGAEEPGNQPCSHGTRPVDRPHSELFLHVAIGAGLLCRMLELA